MSQSEELKDRSERRLWIAHRTVEVFLPPWNRAIFWDIFERVLCFQFAETREPWEGANCHKAIMFFSDGGTDWPQELSTRSCSNSSSDCTRVFTFGCGPHPIPTVVLKTMACKTRGFFSSITALGAIQNRIQVRNTFLCTFVFITKKKKVAFRVRNLARSLKRTFSKMPNRNFFG